MKNDETIEKLIERHKNFRTYVRTINLLTYSSEGKAHTVRAVNTPIGMFPSKRAAAAAYGVHESTFHNWVVNPRKPEFYYIKENDEENRTETE